MATISSIFILIILIKLISGKSENAIEKNSPPNPTSAQLQTHEPPKEVISPPQAVNPPSGVVNSKPEDTNTTTPQAVDPISGAANPTPQATNFMPPPQERPTPVLQPFKDKPTSIRKKETFYSVKKISGSITKKQITKDLIKFIPAFTKCFDKSKKLSNGSAVLKWQITNKGNVKKAHISNDKFKNPILKKCLIGTLEKAKFTSSKKESAIEYLIDYR